MNTKELIMKGAFRLFLEKGFAEVSINEILSKTVITKGCFYHHFKSKDDLITEVINKYICPFYKSPIENMKKELKSDNRHINAEDKLKYYYFNIHRFVIPQELEEACQGWDFRNFNFLVFEGMKKYKFLSHMRRDIYQEEVDIFKKILDEGKEEGIIDASIDTSEWAMTISAIKDGIISLKLLDESVNINEKCEISFKHLLDEIKA